MFTLLSGDQRPGPSNCSTDYREYKLQVSDNVSDIHDIQQVIMADLLTTFISLMSIFLQQIPPKE